MVIIIIYRLCNFINNAARSIGSTIEWVGNYGKLYGKVTFTKQ